jgi:O-antigen/teichoic acid export membrane protein
MVLLLGKEWIDLVLYDGKYSAYVSLVPLMGIAPLLNALVSGLSLLLRALQKPVFYVIDKILAAAVGYLSAVVLVQLWNVTGAVLSLISIEIFTLVLYWFLYVKWFKGLKAKGSEYLYER